jgi:hypothetical protein
VVILSGHFLNDVDIDTALAFLLPADSDSRVTCMPAAFFSGLVQPVVRGAHVGPAGELTQRVMQQVMQRDGANGDSKAVAFPGAQA